ncbi:MAG TPA: hypothetical protein VN456_18025 [Desulfosporosinus sp.]|nr:hypothetical protein [Desulfosporosinus sp.]
MPTISQEQGCPSRGGIRRQLEAKFRPKEHEYHQALDMGRVCHTKRSPINYTDIPM